MIAYRWEPGRAVKGVEAQTVGEELDRIRIDRGGILKPENVVEEAKASSSPLHGCFEWNDEKAANEHRKWQARDLIRSVSVVYEDEEGSRFDVPGFYSVVRVNEEGKADRGYQATAVLVNDKEQLKEALDLLKGKLRSAKDSLNDLSVLVAKSKGEVVDFETILKAKDKIGEALEVLT